MGGERKRPPQSTCAPPPPPPASPPLWDALHRRVSEPQRRLLRWQPRGVAKPREPRKTGTLLRTLHPRCQRSLTQPCHRVQMQKGRLPEVRGLSQGLLGYNTQSASRSSGLPGPGAEPFSGQRGWVAVPLPRPSDVELLLMHCGPLSQVRPHLPHSSKFRGGPRFPPSATRWPGCGSQLSLPMAEC